MPRDLTNVSAIARGRYHCLALKSDGTVTAWGDGSYKQCGVPSDVNYYKARAIAAGAYHSLALKSDHTVVAWGAGGPGQTNYNFPNYGQSIVPPDLNGVAAIAAGGEGSLALIGRPRIESQPQSLAAVLGSTVELEFVVTGVTPLACQWFFNATNSVFGATSPFLQLANIQPSQSGAYTLVVSNACGSVTSAPSMLTVAVGPVIVSQPMDQTVWPRATADFSVASVGLMPMTYQWFFGSNAIPQATNSTLQLTNVQSSQIGTYTVVIANDYGAVTSTPAMLEFYPTFTVTNCTEADLRAAMARGGTVTFACDGTIILASTITNTHDLVLDGSGHSVTISGNNAVRVFVVPTNVTLTLNHLTIADGVTDGWGYGGGGLLNLGTVNATDCNFCCNVATNLAWFNISPGAAGGAIYNNGSMNLDLCEFGQNWALGGLYLVNDFMYWGADGYGGAIYNSGTLVVHRSDFMNNWAEGTTPENPAYPYGIGYGGAIANSGALWLDSCSIQDSMDGGGLANFGTAAILNTTFVRNWGAIYDPHGDVQLTNCTLAFNSGGITSAGAFLINTLLVTNYANCTDGWVTDGGHNLSSDASCAFTNVGSMNNTDPRLGPLADNGGPTLTMALLPGSPAIDAGDTAAAPPTDQRGFRRPFGASADIGAYEYGFVTIATPPATRTAEMGSATELCVEADEYPSQTYQWFLNDIALDDPITNSCLQLCDLQASQGGVYTVVVSNIFGVVTSTPAMLNVIPVVERRPIPAINLTGEAGSSLNVEYTDRLGPPSNWLPLDSVNLTNPPQICVDLDSPKPAQRFYRVWQTGTPGVTPSLDLHFVPAIALAGNIGDTLRLDYINAIGPTDAWVTLDTVTLTNTSQLYFDTSSIGQPRRLYRIVPEP